MSTERPNLSERRQRITFTVPYPGGEASSNRGYTLRKWTDKAGREHMGLRLTAEAKAFKNECLLMARQAWSTSRWLPTPDDPLTITIQATFPTKVHSDVGNLGKYIMDAIADALDGYVTSGKLYNDRDWALLVEHPQYRQGCEPTITVTVEGKP